LTLTPRAPVNKVVKGHKEMRRIFFATLILMPILAAAADKVEVYDEYKGCGGNWNLSMRTMILDESADEFAAQVAMGTPGCSGYITAIGTLSGKRASLRPYRKEDPDDQCVLTLTFDKGGKEVEITEVGCSYWHGAACEFKGKLRNAK
jgi:hypothetical protein